MKNYIKYMGILLVGFSLTFTACKDDSYVVPLVVVNTPVSFDTIVIPIFNASCAISGCHVAGAQAPDLSPSNAFNNLWQYALVDTTSPASSVLYEHLTGTGGQSLMPPVGALSPTQKGQILAWIKQGAQNN
jgi:hypothetical protein